MHSPHPPGHRRLWPAGFIGLLRYFTDRVVLRFSTPVDWHAMHAHEHGIDCTPEEMLRSIERRKHRPTHHD